MFKFKIFILLGLFASHSQAQVVTSSASGTATVDGLSVEHRPSKLFRCWGGPDQSTQYSQGTGGSSREKSGNLALHDGAFNSDYQPLNLQWNADYSDQTFNIDFVYDVETAARNDTHSDCSDNENYRKVKNANANIQSSVEITVPASVWFVRIEREDIRRDLANVTSTVSGTESVKSVQTENIKTENIADDGGDFYYSTKPGDKITLIVNWNPNALDRRQLTSKYKLTFVGKDHCEALTQKFGATKLANLTSIFNSQLKSKDLILTMGCLLNDEIAMRVLKGNEPGEVSVLINNLEQLGLSKEPELLKYGSKPLRLISQFAYYKIAYEALNDITSFCSEAKISDPLTSHDNLTVNGFIVNYYFLSRILYRLKAFDFSRFSAFIQVLDERAKSFGTYSKLKNSNEDFLRVYNAYNILKASISQSSSGYSMSTLPFTSTLYYFDRLKLGQLNRDAFSEIRSQLVILSGLEENFKRHFGEIKWKLSTAPNEAVDTSVFSRDLETISKSNFKIINFFEAKKRWFNTPDPAEASSPYITDMTQYMLMVKQFSESTGDLDLVRHRPNFLKAYNPEVPLKGVNKCLSSEK
jgi:hypothetical protein